MLITSPVVVHAATSAATLSDVPLLREHICVPPHSLVTSAGHSYSFTEDGDEVCFHSPLSLPEGGTRLGDWLVQMVGDTNQRHMIIGDEARDVLAYLIKGRSADEMLSHPRDVFDERNTMAAWMMWGEHLAREQSIEQYALLRWKD